MNLFRWLDSLLMDLHFTVRQLWKKPAFTAIVLFTLALGVAANIAIFSIINAVFLTPPAVHEPERLAYIYGILQHRLGPIDPDAYEFFSRYNEAFSQLTWHWTRVVRLVTDAGAELTSTESVTANYFDVLGVKSQLGRGFLPENDDPASSARSIVISHRLWARRFKADPDIVGKTVQIGDPFYSEVPPQTFTIIGVTPPSFKGISSPWTPTDLWIPEAQVPRRQFVTI